MESVGRTDHSPSTGAVQDMSIDHGRLDIAMPEQFLNGPDVVPGHQKMGREAVPKGMATDSLRDPEILRRFPDRPSDDGLMKMMPTNLTRPRIDSSRSGREDVLPVPIALHPCQLAIEGRRDIDVAVSISEVLFVVLLDHDEMVFEATSHAIGEHRDPILVAFGIMDSYMGEIEVDVFDPQAKALEDPHSSSVEHEDDELHHAIEATDDGRCLFATEHRGQPFGRTSSNDLIEPWKVHFEDFTVEKQQR